MKKAGKIWKKDWDISHLNSWSKNTMMETIGIEYTEIGENYLQAKMPVDKRTHNPVGILHGGASVALAETLGSIASYLVLEGDDKQPVGMEINANHIRSVSTGFVNGKCTPIHLGNTSHLWEIKITNEKGDLVCVSRFTVFVRAIR